MTETPGRICCDLLPWDSEFFGVRIGRLAMNRLDAVRWISVEAWCRDNAVECLYFLADPSEDETARTAEKNQFRMVDIRLTLEYCLSATVPVTADSTVEKFDSLLISRSCSPDELDALADIARTSHRDSRFYHDGNFSRARCDDLFETWLRKSMSGLAKVVFIASIRSCPIGYITCNCLDGKTAQIGLFGIAAAFRGAGIGRQLLGSAAAWARGEGLEVLTVVTQGRNIDAQRFYQYNGFITADLKIWYHRWFARL